MRTEIKTELVVRVRPTLKAFRGIPSLVPFFCVFFILLVFFLVGTNFVPIHGIPVDLPRGVGETIYASRTLIVTIDRDANIIFNDHISKDIGVIKPLIADALRSLTDNPEGERLIVRCDVNAPISAQWDVLSMAKELNVNAVLIGGQKDEVEKTTFAETE